MTSTRHIVTLGRTSHCLATAIVTVALAVGSAAVARAEWDIEAYDKCMDDPNTDTFTEFKICCESTGGIYTRDLNCRAPSVNDPMTGQPAPPRSPEDIVTGPTRQFDVPDASVPGDPIIVFPAP